MSRQRMVFKWAERIADGEPLEQWEWERLVAWPKEAVWDLLPGAGLLRQNFCGTAIHLCTISNAKSGGCTENCGFCSQSQSASGPVPIYPLISPEEIVSVGEYAAAGGVHRFSAVTAGRGLPVSEVEAVAAGLGALRHSGIERCASLGIVSEKALSVLRAAGVSRYHHNLETARSYFPQVCTSHSYDERVQTIQRAQAAGFSICSGGIFGCGENDAHVLELGRELASLDASAVPINFFVPIEGTALASRHSLTPLRCLKIIALLRLLLPDKELIVCGGREHNLRELHPFIFQAGASGIMTGNYLTTSGRTLPQDLELLADLGLTVR